MNAPVQPPHVPDDLVVAFNMYTHPDLADDFHAAWAKLKQGPAVVWTTENEGHWITTRPELFDEIYLNHELFSSSTIILPESHGDAHDLIPTTMDPPEHQPYRMILNNLMAPAVIQGLSDEVRAVTAGLLDALVPQGGCEFTTAFAQQLPLHVFMSLMDLPREDIAQVKYWSDQTTHPDGSLTFAEALDLLYSYLEPYIIARQENPGNDFLSGLVNAEVNGRKVNDSEARRLAVQLLIAGVDTVVNFLSHAFLRLARDNDLRKRIASGDLPVVDAAEHLLAGLPLVTVGRRVMRDVDFHGAPLKAGDMIAIPTPLCAGFLGRSGQSTDALRSHLTFGRGVHQCPGRHLARMEVQIVLEEWFKRIPDFTVKDGETVRFQGGIVGVVEALPLSW